MPGDSFLALLFILKVQACSRVAMLKWLASCVTEQALSLMLSVRINDQFETMMRS